MPFDFSSDSELILKEFSNADVMVGVENLRGIYDAPSRPVSSFDLQVVSSAPSLSLSWDKVQELEITSGTMITVTPDKAADGIDYEVAGEPLHDGAGLAQLTLTEA